MKTRKHEKKRVTAIGELVVEFVPTEIGRCLQEVKFFQKCASGSVGTFACAISGLGEESRILASVGEDEFSSFVLKALKSRGVDISKIRIIPDKKIGLAFVENMGNGRKFIYYRDRSAGSFLAPLDIDSYSIKSSAAIHYSGMLLYVSKSMRDACFKAVEIARNSNTIVSFDPNIRKELMGHDTKMELIYDAIKSADIITPSKEEATLLTGEKDVIKAAESLFKMGPRIVVITLGKDGCFYATNSERFYSKGFKVNMVEPTGGGDVFAAALITGIINKWEPHRIAEFANAAGALMVTKVGLIEAVPSRIEVEKFLKMRRYKHEKG